MFTLREEWVVFTCFFDANMSIVLCIECVHTDQQPV